MATAEKLAELKKNLGLGKFENYNFAQLCALIEPAKFYKTVGSPENLRSYLQAVLFEYCKLNGYTPAAVSFSDKPLEELAYTKKLLNGESTVVFNSVLKDMFAYMAHHKNNFYPYLLILSTIHEAVHVGQNEATVNTQLYNKLPTDLKIAVLDKMLNTEKIIALTKGELNCNPDGEDYVSSALMLEKVFRAAKIRENPLYDYANSPEEITARDYSILAVSDIIYSMPQSETKSLLTEFVKESKHHSLQMLYDKSVSNYGFFEELERGQLYESIPHIKEKQEKLIKLVDSQLAQSGKGTFSEYLDANNEEFVKVAEEIERLSNLNGMVGMIVSEDTFTRHCDKLAEELDENRHSRLRVLNKNYTTLFPSTHALTIYCPKPAPFVYSEQLVFDSVKEQLSKGKAKQ